MELFPLQFTGTLRCRLPRRQTETRPLELQDAGWTEHTQSAGLAYPFRDRREEVGLSANIRLATGKTCAAHQASHVAAPRSIVHRGAQQIVRSGSRRQRILTLPTGSV